ncbi:L,D-transpeptidase [Nocardioides insulae]|uniref:L,D-transpeptidase n=1 Tax=Nocardioides insulae TaxID=394734 RepID=UPI0004081B52|nr:Ig-like domain-containing protein [Nocardioides insulae]
MSWSRHVRSRPRAVVAGLAALAVPLALAGCESGGGSAAEPDSAGSASAASSSAAPEDPVAVAVNVRKGADKVAVDTRVRVTAQDGELTKVTVTSPEGKVPGKVSADGTSWTASALLEPGTTYLVRSHAAGEQGGAVDDRTRFTTQDLSLSEQTFASIAPLDGETVGVGMPVVVNFDVPVTDKKSFEKHMTVTSTPAQAGSWHWMSDTEAHWRPKNYWKAGTEVSVDVAVNSIPAGGGIYGQKDRSIDFTVGDSHVTKVDVANHRMKVFENGKLIRTFSVTTGKDGFTTRSGVKVIMEKYESKRMNSETVGIGEGDPEYYDIDNVEWAMRVTNSGEFIHAAPWSSSSQGLANVSHGCTGMSTADAKWLYDFSRRGDVVEYTGSDRQMTLDNGFGDWNLGYAQYAQGSALS